MVTRVAMASFSYYPADVRPRREAEALVEAGMSVDVICLRDDTEAQKEEVKGVCVHRLGLHDSIPRHHRRKSHHWRGERRHARRPTEHHCCRQPRQNPKMYR